MRWKGLAIACVALSSGSALGIAINFTWTGDADGVSWTSGCNWLAQGLCSPSVYPRQTNHNARLPTNSDITWAIDLSDESIGKFTIEEDVDFGRIGTDPVTLDCTKLIIDATGVGATDAGVEAKFVDLSGTEIIANAPPP